MGSKLVQMCQMCSSLSKTCSNVFKCVQNCSKIIRFSSAWGPTWQAELDLVLKGSLNLLIFSSRDSINLIDQLAWHLPTRVQTSGEGGALWRIFWPKGASPRCKSYSDFWITRIVSQKKALRSNLLKVVALMLWMLKRSNLHNNCIEMGIK